jgi:hypothetical protein
MNSRDVKSTSERRFNPETGEFEISFYCPEKCQSLEIDFKSVPLARKFAADIMELLNCLKTKLIKKRNDLGERLSEMRIAGAF